MTHVEVEIDAVLLDIDGTLMDTNMLHVLAWQRALRRVGRQTGASEIVHLMGMGGDKLAPTVLGEDADDEIERVRQFQAEEYIAKGLAEHAEPLPGATDLLRALRERGVKVALASSAKAEEVESYIDMLGGEDAVDAITTAADVSGSKPDPDIFEAALAKLGHPASALVIGDTVYDIEAATRSGLPCIAVLTGGIEREVLTDAGAHAVYTDLPELLADLDQVLRLGSGV